MNKLIAPRYGDILDKKEWVVYTYLVSKAWYGCDDSQPLKRGQLFFKSSEIDWLMSETYTRDTLRDLVNKGLIHKQLVDSAKKNGSLITICNYDDVCNLLPRLKRDKSAIKARTEECDIIDDIDCFKNEGAVDTSQERDSSYIERKPRKTRNKNSIADDTPSGEPTKPKNTRKQSKPKEHTPAFRVWTAYAEAHKVRYPPKDDKPLFRPTHIYKVINTMLEQVDEEELIKRVRYYVEKFNDSKIVEAKHPLSWLDSRMNEVVDEAEKNKPEDVPMKWCQYRNQMVPKKKILINGETRWI